MLKILIVLAVALGAFLIYVSLKPSHQRIARSIVIHAPPAKVFPSVNTRSIANSWNPFLQKDPTAKITTSGPEVGVGAKTSWVGGKELGVGSAEVIESAPNDHVIIKLVYEKPFAMEQTATYQLEPVSEGTKVTWKVEGEATFMAKLMCTFMNMDKMVGDVFSQGLGQLKTMVESNA